MKNCISQRRESAGFTLIEVVISLAISGIFLSAVYTAFMSQQNSYLAQDQVVEMQQNIRAGVSGMVQELHMAGYDPYSSGSAGIETAGSDTVTFTVVADDDGLDNNNDGTTDETGELETVTFDFYDAYDDGDMDIGRQVGDNAATKRAIAENFDALEFVYLDADENVTTDPDKVKSIQISVLARVGQPDRNFNHNETYTSVSGAVWGPYNDHFRRRFQIVTVHLRNLEI